MKNERAWTEPLVGFSSGANPLYGFYKEDIGSFFMTPLEWFTKTFHGVEVAPEELTVISWILPPDKGDECRTSPAERHAHRAMGEVQRVPEEDKEVRGVDLRLRGVRLRTLPDGRPLRVPHPP